MPASNAHAMLFGLIAMILEHFDQRPVPRAIGEVEWRAARAELERSLNDLARARPKTAETVARDHSSFYLAIMPLHPKLGADDFAALSSQLKLALLQIQEAFAQRANLPALAERAGGPRAEGRNATRRRPRRRRACLTRAGIRGLRGRHLTHRDARGIDRPRCPFLHAPPSCRRSKPC